jgi:replicative DNA helicase
MKDKASKEDFGKDYFDFLLNNDDALNEITELLIEKIFCKYNIDFYAQEIFKSLIKRKMLKVLNKHKNLLVNSDSFIDLMVENLTPENLEKDVTNLRIKIIEDLYLY